MTGVIYNPKSVKLYSFPRSFSEKSRTRDWGRKIPLTQRHFYSLYYNVTISSRLIHKREFLRTTLSKPNLTNSTVFAYSYHMETNNRCKFGKIMFCDFMSTNKDNFYIRTTLKRFKIRWFLPQIHLISPNSPKNCTFKASKVNRSFRAF